jgi:predicted ATPase
MLTELRVNDFTAIPYLEASTLMRTHGKELTFSRAQPNVVVGPNGSGKSALLNTLAVRFLTYFSSQSTLDRRYVLDVDARAWWTRKVSRHDKYVWLKGLICKTDNAPALYYRPGHVPGNEPTIADAMMSVYWEPAQEYAKLVDRKSSGEQNQAVLGKLLEALEGKNLPAEYAQMNWEFGAESTGASAPHAFGEIADLYEKAEVLKAMYRPAANAVSLILMDEPEQSLDTMAEAQLWSCISKVDCQKMQIIVATHSLYPLLHKNKFHIIESQNGYVKDVLELMA